MSTQDKNIKVVSTTDFDNNKIINAKIDASENEITGVSTELYAGNNISIDGATISAIVPTKVSELDNDSQYITNVVDDLVNYTTTANLSSVALSGNYNDLINKPIIDSELSDNSTNAVENKVITTALNEKASLVEVTDSGAILPSITGYEVGNTFLNTIDKKLYTAKTDSYKLNSGVIVESPVSVDLQTGIASNFFIAGSDPHSVRRTNVIQWVENTTLEMHIKISTNTNQVIASIYSGSASYKSIYFYLMDMKLYCGYASGNMGPSTQQYSYLLADYQLSTNTEYFIRINKYATSVKTSIFTGGYDIQEEYNNITNDMGDWKESDSSILYYGVYTQGPIPQVSLQAFTGQIYLLDSTGEFLVPDTSSLAWDNGENLTDLTQYADITNNILYFYANTQFFYSNQIPSQSGQNGKFLTTNGTSLSWAEVQGGGSSFSQTDYYEMAEVENMVNMTGTISIDLDKYLTEVSADRWLETYIYDGTNWKNYDEQVVDFSTLGIDGSSATFVSGSSFDVSSVCLRNKTEFSVSSVLTINALYLNGLLMLKKDYSVGSNNRITFNGYTLKATDAISIM